MTVMVIIGLMSGAVILTLPKDKPALEMFAQSLVQDANAAAQASLLSGRSTALGLSEAAYAILVFEDGDWQTRKQIKWPAQVFAEYTNATQSLDLPEDLTPLAVFEPIGQSTVFTLSLRGDDHSYTLKSDGTGRVILSADQ